MTALVVSNLEVRIGGRLLVQDANFSARGMTAIVGPNGAGKSTLLSTIVGLRAPSAGTVTFGGDDLVTMSRRLRARTVAFVEQNATTEERLTVLDVVALGRIPHGQVWQAGPTAHDRAAAEQALVDVEMTSFADRQFRTLSGGEQQRVQLARALAQEPRLLVLDEPTSHLDISAQMMVLELLRSKARGGLAILLALHDLNLATAYCDGVVVIKDGRTVAEGAPAAVLSPALLEQVYGVSATTLRHPVSGRPVIVFEPRDSH